jgi:hypothetical protein
MITGQEISALIYCVAVPRDDLTLPTQQREEGRAEEIVVSSRFAFDLSEMITGQSVFLSTVDSSDASHAAEGGGTATKIAFSSCFLLGGQKRCGCRETNKTELTLCPSDSSDASHRVGGHLEGGRANMCSLELSLL